VVVAHGVREDDVRQLDGDDLGHEHPAEALVDLNQGDDMGLDGPELGESEGSGTTSAAHLDGGDFAEQNSDLDKEVNSLGAQVAALEKDNGMQADDEAALPKKHGDVATNPEMAKSKHRAQQSEKGASTAGKAPRASRLRDSIHDSNADSEKTGAHLKSAAQEKLHDLVSPEQAAAADKAAAKKKMAEIKAAEQKKAAAADKQDKEAMSNAEKTAEMKTEAKAEKLADKKPAAGGAPTKAASGSGGGGGSSAVAVKMQAAYAGGKAASSKPLVLKEQPKGLPDPPDPKKTKDSKKVAAAKKKPMPAVPFKQVVPNGKYSMQNPKDIQRKKELSKEAARDKQIAKGGGKATAANEVDKTPSKASKPGAIQTTDGPVEEYFPVTPTSTGYCSKYAARRNTKKKWTKNSCLPTMGHFEEIVQNIDGVICACGGLKVSNVPPSDERPGVQESVIFRAQVTKERIRSFGSKMTTSVVKEDPQPSRGFSWDIHLTTQDATRSDHDIDPKKMRVVSLKINRVFEFADHTGAGLTEEDTKHVDSASGKLWPGRPCDVGAMTSKKDPGKNCVVQDFFLDNFQLSMLEVQGKKMTFKVQSDVQGTTPWCSKKQCADPPAKKPKVSFIVKVDGPVFENSKLNIEIEDFPFKHSNTSVALAAALYASTVKADISEDDEVSAVKSTDKMDCSSVPPAVGCPQIALDGTDVNFNWVKSVTDAGTGASQKVVTTSPVRKKSGAVSSNGDRLIHKSMYFSFKHGMSKKLIWDPEMTSEPSALPRDSKSSAFRHATAYPVAIVTLAALVLGLTHQ